MSTYARDLWQRAGQALRTACRDAEGQDYDATASRAYYAAFYVVSAVLAWEGKTFTKHSAVEAALHRDLVRDGNWDAEMGADYRALRSLRNTGDYGGLEHVSAEQAAEAISAAQRLFDAALTRCPELGG